MNDTPSPAVEKVPEEKSTTEENILWEGDSDEKMFKPEEFLEDEVSEEKVIEIEEDKTSEKRSVTQLNETSDSEQEQENEVDLLL